MQFIIKNIISRPKRGIIHRSVDEGTLQILQAGFETMQIRLLHFRNDSSSLLLGF